MGEINWKNIHIRKEATDCKYERHVNPCKKYDLGFAILLKLSPKHTYKKLHWFQPFLLLQEVYL